MTPQEVLDQLQDCYRAEAYYTIQMDKTKEKIKELRQKLLNALTIQQ